MTPNPAPTPAIPHCDDASTTINGFPNQCRDPAEGQEANDTTEATMNTYRPIALVNRMDLAHEGWRNCGEFRIVYAKREASPSDIKRNLIIFEAILPNPKPGCREGCLEAAKLWKSLSGMTAALDRAQALEKFYYQGHADFRPVVHVDHYSATGVTSSYGSSGSGQIRTNQFWTPNFNQFPWMLKEFKTVIDCGGAKCAFNLFPISVRVNPFGPLWSERFAHDGNPLAQRALDFQASVLTRDNLDQLADGRINGIGYSVEPVFNAAQSFSLVGAGFVDNYRDQFALADPNNTVFRNDLAAAAQARGLTANQMVNRAITQSCAGCHKPDTFGIDQQDSLGAAVAPGGTLVNRWPAALSFVHTDGVSSSPSELNQTWFAPGTGHALSDALKTTFLPERKNFMLGQLNASECACVHQFRFLPASRVASALAAQRRIDLTATRDLQGMSRDTGDATLESRIAGKRKTRDEALRSALAKEKIDLPKQPSLKAQTLKLKASRATNRSDTQRKALLDEVSSLVNAEPPRRTVTGSFRVH